MKELAVFAGQTCDAMNMTILSSSLNLPADPLSL